MVTFQTATISMAAWLLILLRHAVVNLLNRSVLGVLGSFAARQTPQAVPWLMIGQMHVARLCPTVVHEGMSVGVTLCLQLAICGISC